MLAFDAQRQLDQAAVKTVQRIRSDHAKAPPRVQPLLAYLEEHLFDPSLDANHLFRACSIRDNTMSTRFHKAVGLPPYAYIEDCRLRTACRLLGESTMKIWEIANILGYSELQVFSRAFKRWSGFRPTVYRRQERRNESGESTSLGIDQAEPNVSTGQGTRGRRGSSPVAVDTLRRAMEGTLGASQARGLIHRLQKLYPGAARLTGGNAQLSVQRSAAEKGAGEMQLLGLDADDIKTIRLDEVWNVLVKLPFDEQRTLVGERLRTQTPDLFHMLCARSRKVGRSDRKRGVPVAELALHSLDALDRRYVSDRELATLRALGWAWLGNARRLTFDLPAADSAFAMARRYLPAREEAPLALAEILGLEAALRWYQRRFPAALSLIDQSLPILRHSSRVEQYAQFLMLKANMLRDAGEMEQAIVTLREALPSLEERNAPSYLRFVAANTLGVFYADNGQHREAAALLPEMRTLCGALDERISDLHMRWLDGLVAAGLGQHHGAEDALLEARQGFVELEQHGQAAMLSLDLAELYLAEERADDVLKMTSEAIPLFQMLENHPAAMAVLKVLQEAVSMGKIRRHVLQRSRLAWRRLQVLGAAAG